MEFGQRLKELRKDKMMSQRDLASRAGIDFTYLSKIEKGRMPPPSKNTIVKLAEALEADADELLVLAKKIPLAIDSVPPSKGFLQFLRTASKHPLSDEEWMELIDKITSKGKRK
jgi:transcriptional regulator with XRE-family HTH domain